LPAWEKFDKIFFLAVGIVYPACEQLLFYSLAAGEIAEIAKTKIVNFRRRTVLFTQ